MPLAKKRNGYFKTLHLFCLPWYLPCLRLPYRPIQLLQWLLLLLVKAHQYQAWLWNHLQLRRQLVEFIYIIIRREASRQANTRGLLLFTLMRYARKSHGLNARLICLRNAKPTFKHRTSTLYDHVEHAMNGWKRLRNPTLTFKYWLLQTLNATESTVLLVKNEQNYFLHWILELPVAPFQHKAQESDNSGKFRNTYGHFEILVT